LAAALVQADVPFDRATRLAVRRACGVSAAKAAGADDGDNDGDDEAVAGDDNEQKR
jgi:hypothetical protein